jgi:hypothetical protein
MRAAPATVAASRRSPNSATPSTEAKTN